MIVGTPHFALRDLGFDTFPTCSIDRHHLTDGGLFVTSYMVELQHPHVRLTAIDTWMHEQVLDESCLVLADDSQVAIFDARLVRLTVTVVVRF